MKTHFKTLCFCASMVLALSGCKSLQVAGKKAPPSKLENPYSLNKPKASHSIVFLGSDRKGDTFLFAMGDNGEAPAYVIDEPVAAVPPRWNPRTRSIAFFSSYHYANQELFSINPDGTNRQWLSMGTTKRAARDADWESDGMGILYLADGSNQREIYLLDMVSGQRVRLTQSPFFQKIFEPRLSPNGEVIAFGIADRDGYSNIGAIYNGDPDNTYTLTKAGVGIHYRSIRWSPDGRWLAAVTDRFGSREIVKIDVNRSLEQRLTYSGGAGESWDPRISPDGKWICYTSNRANGMGVYRMDMDGRQDYRCTPPDIQAGQAAWYPDSKTLVFVGADRDGNSELYRVDAGGGNLFKMTESQAFAKSYPEVRGARW
jgi:Tol biopolymer transport system component